MKQITGVYTAPAQHWVGDGFPVRSLFSYQTHGEPLSPFLLLDYAVLTTSRQEAADVGLANIRIADLKPSPSSIPVKLNTVTRRVKVGSLARAMCSG